MPLPIVSIARHGETESSLSGQHSGLTDPPLTGNGEAQARRLGERLKGMTFARVLTSPLQRAGRTCELVDLGTKAEIDADLVEWNYGDYEGVRTAEILRTRPGWQLFRDGCPGGESPAETGARADRVIASLRAAEGDSIVFSSGHFSRVLAARWVGLRPGALTFFIPGTASLSLLGYGHDMAEPVIRLWNDTRHLEG